MGPRVMRANNKSMYIISCADPKYNDFGYFVPFYKKGWYDMPGYFRKRKKSYQFIVTIGTDYDGTPIRYSESVSFDECKTDAQAKRHLAEFYARCAAGSVSKESMMTVKALLDMYMETIVGPSLEHTTIYGYRTIVNRLLPLHKSKANKLTKLAVQRYVNEYLIKEKKLTPKTIKNTVSFLHSVFEWALEMDIVRSNPCDHITIPKPEDLQVEENSYTEEELAVFLEGLNRQPDTVLHYKVAALIAVFGGLRRSEVCGLNEDDVLANGVRIIRTRHVDRDNGGVYESTTKTKKSARFVSLPADIMTEIQRVIEKNRLIEDLYGMKTEALFRNPDSGTPMWPDSFGKWTKKLQKELGLKTVVLHGLRHTHASMLVDMNSDIAKVSSRLGHSQVTTTLNIYTHLFRKDETELVENISEKYFGKKSV